MHNECDAETLGEMLDPTAITDALNNSIEPLFPDGEIPVAAPTLPD